MLADGVVFDGARRRLLILLARGRLVQELAASDWAIMNAEVDRTPGAEIGGRPVSQPDVTAMRAWEARLPPGAPDDLYLVASGALMKMAQERIEMSFESSPEALADATGIRIARLVSDPLSVPAAAGATEPLSIVMYTAVAAGPDCMILSDQGAPAGAAVYTATGPHHEERTCVSFDYFERRVLRARGFDLEAIEDGSLLADACRLL